MYKKFELLEADEEDPNAMFGFIYIASNLAMPGLLKIGFTTKDPEERLAALSSVSSIPLPFDLVQSFAVVNPAKLEAEIHDRLFKVRVSPQREFFRIDTEKAVSFVGKLAYGVSTRKEITVENFKILVKHHIDQPNHLGVKTPGDAINVITKIIEKTYKDLKP